MSETKQVFSIDKPGAYKLRGGGSADIVEVNHKSAFGWLRSDTSPMSMRRWDRTGVADAGFQDIIEAIPFVVDGPGRYMMRNGRVAKVGIVAPADKASQPVCGMDGFAKRTWHLDGSWSSDGHKGSLDLVRKMHPLEQEPGAKAPEASKAPEIKKEPKKPTVAITHLGKYRARNGRLVCITHTGNETVIGCFDDEREPVAWLIDGRFNEHCESDEDIVEKIEQEASEPKKPSAGFDVVIIQSNGGALTQTVAGIYTERNGVATMHPADVDEVYMASKRPAALMLKRGDFVRCPARNVTCVIHYGGEE